MTEYTEGLRTQGEKFGLLQKRLASFTRELGTLTVVMESEQSGHQVSDDKLEHNEIHKIYKKTY